MGLCVNVFAANENNTKGVVFSVELDKPNLTVSDEDQTVRMTFTADKEFETCSVSYTASTGEFPVTALNGGANMPAATVNPVTKMLSWNSNDGNVVKMQEFGIVDVIIPANTPAGTYELGFSKLKLSENYGADIWESTATAYATLTIAPAPVAVSSITLSESKLDMFVGDNVTLTATVLPAEATEKDVTWTSSDASVATVVNGKVTAVGAGDATITATAGGKSATCKVTVSTKTPEPVLITGITLKDTSMKVGDKKTLTAVIAPADATNQALRWSIENSDIASIDETTGVVTALKEGTTKVTAKATDGSGVSATCKLTVEKKDSTIVIPGEDGGAGIIAGGAIISGIGGDDVPFTDVSFRNYYYNAVKWAVDKGITTGTGRYTFSPDAACTRAQVVTFLWRAAGSPAPMLNENPFTDVHASDYYYDAVLWAVQNGITNGTSAKTFSPDATVTRAQVVTFLWRSQNQPDAAASGFTDVSASAYYAKAVDWAFANGIATGMDYAAFGPDAACTRAQIVTFLYRSAR